MIHVASLNTDHTKCYLNFTSTLALRKKIELATDKTIAFLSLCIHARNITYFKHTFYDCYFLLPILVSLYASIIKD